MHVKKLTNIYENKIYDISISIIDSLINIYDKRYNINKPSLFYTCLLYKIK